MKMQNLAFQRGNKCIQTAFSGPIGPGQATSNVWW